MYHNFFNFIILYYRKEAQKCYCESPNCRGWIGQEPDSSSESSGSEIEDYDEDIVYDEINIKDNLEKLHNEILLDKIEIDNNKNKCIDIISVNEQDTINNDTVEVDLLMKKDMPIIAPKKKIIKRIKDINKTRKPIKTKIIKDIRTDSMQDHDLDKEIDELKKTNLKNQLHTLKFSRLVVRAKQQQTKSQLLLILRKSELTCRRLFLDYHGLKLLYSWMCYGIVGKDLKLELEFIIEILETLELLPIPNKTMLTDSKVLLMAQKWSTFDLEIELKLNNKKISSNDSNSCSPITTFNDILNNNNKNINSDNNSNSNDSYNNHGGSPKINKDDDSSNAIINKTVPTIDPLLSDLIERIRSIATHLCQNWETLPEVFRIPKKLRIQQMKEHEREADRSYSASIIEDKSNQKTNNRYKPYRNQDRYWDRDRERNRKEKKLPYESVSSLSSTSSATIFNDSHLTKFERRQLFEAKVNLFIYKK